MRQAFLAMVSFAILLVFSQPAFSANSTSSNTTGSNSSSFIPPANMTVPVPANSTESNNTASNANPAPVPANSTKPSLPAPDTTSTAISQAGATTQDLQVQLTARVSDTTNSSSVPTGIVSLSDGGAGGTFGAPTCILASGACTVSYTIPSNHDITITITASYGGDGTHAPSSATITPSTPHDTSVSITPNPATITPGVQDAFTVQVSDVTGAPTAATGTVSWSDGGIGGSFGSPACTLAAGTCTVSYLPPSGYTDNITITASYGGDAAHYASKSTYLLELDMRDKTSTVISPGSVTTSRGTQAQFTATVGDLADPQSTPGGTISWSDGGAGGTFGTASCILASGTCTVTYTTARGSESTTTGSNGTSHLAMGVRYLGPPGSITITGSYGGDGTHDKSTGTATLKVYTPHNTATTVSPSQGKASQGSTIQVTVTASDTSGTPSVPTGTISLDDGGAGGIFDPSSCTISSGSCTVSYTTSQASQGIVTINATYGGDSLHHPSSASSRVDVVALPSSISLRPDQAYYAHGDVATLSVSLPGQVMQNIAVGVSNPAGDNIISRTITTDGNGTGMLQFKIPSSYPTGTYQGVVSALVYGKNYTNSTQFTVIKSHGISIDSVQITDQHGSPSPMLSSGQNGFVRVSLSSDEKMPVLLTLNLFDANQSSLGTASLQSTITPGSTQVSLSFFIPPGTQAGVANVYTDAYSDWPGSGGTPLAPESCLAADLQDPASIPAGYVPVQPHSCTNSSGTAHGPSYAALTNSQARLTLGIEIQNDTMTFMSPTQAHLLALAYQNRTGSSVGLVTLDPSSLASNATRVGPDQFTTLAGPDVKSSPLAMKILKEIEASKRQVADILGNETAAKLDAQLVLKQRQAAAGQLKQDLATLAQQTANTTSDAAYAGFLNTVDDARARPVFQDEYNFMKQRLGAANTAMENVLDSGGSLGQALATFNRYATINHVQMVSLNTELNIAYGLADSRVQSCFDSSGRLPTVNGTSQCLSDIQSNSTGPGGVSIVSVQATDQNGSPVSLLQRGQTGYVKVVLDSSLASQSLVTINLFDSDVSSLGTASAQYTLSPGQSEVVLPYYVPSTSAPGLASVYANIFTDWPDKGGVSKSNELSYFVGLS